MPDCGQRDSTIAALQVRSITVSISLSVYPLKHDASTSASTCTPLSRQAADAIAANSRAGGSVSCMGASNSPMLPRGLAATALLAEHVATTTTATCGDENVRKRQNRNNARPCGVSELPPPPPPAPASTTATSTSSMITTTGPLNKCQQLVGWQTFYSIHVQSPQKLEAYVEKHTPAHARIQLRFKVFRFPSKTSV